MKKLMLFASALAGLFLAASCQQENLEPVRSNTVTITVEAPGAINTKAIADGTNVNEVHYAVYKTNSGEDYSIDDSGAIDGPLAQGVVEMINNRASIDFDLLRDQNFTVIFWAQVAGADHYTLGDLRTITIDNAVVDGNDETRAAFFARYDFSTYEHQDHTVTLRRPFAQLNLLTTLESLTPVQQGQTTGYTIDVQTSEVKVIGLGRAFNTLTGVAPAADETLLYEMAATPAKQGQATLTVGAKDYHYVSMNYLFVPEEEKLVNIEYSIVTDKGSIEHEIVAVPVKENYRTNIIGNLFTKETKFEIIVDAEFETPEHVIGDDWTQTGEYKYVVNEGASAATLADILAHADAQAKAAATKAAGPEVIITLNGDVEWETGAGIGSTPLLPEDSPISAVVINGNGKTFTATGKGVGKIRLANGALLTFNNVKVVDHSVSYAENSWEYGYLEFGGNLAFNECQFVNAIMMESENAAFTNCSFNSNKDNEYAVWVNEGNTTFNGCTFTGARGLKVHEAYGSEVASVVVDGCTFGPLTKKPGIALGDLNAETSVTIKNSTFDGCQAGDQKLYMYETDTDVTTFTFVTENNTVVPSGDEVIEQGEGVVMVATAAGFAKAIEEAEAGDVILVAGSVVLPSGVITSTPGALTIEGYTEDAEVAFNSTAGGADGGLNCYADGMDLLFKNITVVSPNTGSAYSGGFGRAKSVTFENCEYIGQYRAVNAYTKFIHCTIDPQTSYIYTDYANVDFTGCTFNCSEGKGVQVYNDGNNTNTVINVTDCTFTAAKQGATWDGKPVTAIDINSNGEIFKVNITNTTATGFPEGLATASTLFNIKGGAEYVTVMIDGSKFIANGLYEDEQGNAVATSEAGLKEALSNGGTVILANPFTIDQSESNGYGKTGINMTNGGTLDGNGNELGAPGSTGTWDSAINTSGGTIKNIRITAGFRGIFIKKDANHNEKLYLDNVYIDGTTYTISCDSGNGLGLDANACTFYGWTSYAATIGEVAFTGCTFGYGNGYAYCRPYSPTSFVGCAFEAGYKVDPRAAVTFENCTLDGVALTAENLSTLVTSNIANATVK